METTTNSAAKNIPDGSLVVFTPRGQDVELKGKVVSHYVSTLDNNLYLRIKAEDGRTYTKQFKSVELLADSPAAKEEIPATLLKEIRDFSKSSQQKVNEKEVENLVKKFFRKELLVLAKAMK
jgi:hypothetical protein